MPNYQKLMRESARAHRHFKNVWREWRSGGLKDATGLKPHCEPESLINARNEFYGKNDILFKSEIEPLERNFREDPNKSIDEVVEFLSADVMAFRCGYAKESFLRWLKRIKYSAQETKKLQDLTINVCELQSFRREFRRWCHLAILIADEDFLVRLKLLSSTENRYSRVKSKWMLAMIVQNRVDLRKMI